MVPGLRDSGSAAASLATCQTTDLSWSCASLQGRRLVRLKSGGPTMTVEAHHLRTVLQRRGDVPRLQGGHAAAAYVGERGLRPRV